MDDKRIKKVIDSYDSLKTVRDLYIKTNHYEPFYRVVLSVTPIVLILFIVLVFKINLGLIIFLTILSCVLYIVIFFFKKNKEYRVMINYLNKLKSFGFNSINKYEEILNNEVLGEGKYCSQLIDYYKEQYNLIGDSLMVTDLNNNKYYIWCNDQFLYLLPCIVNDISLLKKIRINDVFYYRRSKVDCVLKIRTDVLYFDIFAYDVFANLFPSKKFEMITNFEPGKYIDDFELYMHMKRSDYDNDIKYNNNFLAKIFALYLVFVGIYLCNLFFGFPNTLIMKLVMCFSISLICIIAGEMTDYYSQDVNDENSILNRIIGLDKTQLMFNELKIALNISDSYDTLYTSEGAPYLCWVKNGYFHVFLNKIYYNCVYMVIAVKDIDCYCLNEDNEVVLKTKVKNLTFRNDMKKKFDKILPNKDYAWLNNFKK